MHRVDRVLAGGLHTGELTEIFGASGSGKTQLCMAIAAHAASVKMARVLYVDTCSGFSAQRTQSILLGDWDVQATSDALKRIEVVRTGDVAQVLALIDRIDASAPSPKEQNLVIIDSLGFLLLPLMHSGDYAGTHPLFRVSVTHTHTHTHTHILRARIRDANDPVGSKTQTPRRKP